MIALKNELPLVRHETGHIVAFERDWLLRSLAIAAHRAGYPRWWLAEHVAESVTHHLRNRDISVVPIPQLEQEIKSALQVIGYAEVAQQFIAEPPLIHISLFALAHEAGSGYELAFFELFARKMQASITRQTSYIELHGLEPCVKLLRSKKIWSRDCESLRGEIVHFLREQIQIANHDREITFSLS